MKFSYKTAFLGLLIFSLIGSTQLWAAPPDLTKGEFKPTSSHHDWNLGPTGLRGWMHSERLETSLARQIYITKVDKGSPADTILNVGDVILGVQGKAFSYDPRVELGKAITSAEAKDGKLSFIVWRQGKTANRVIKIKVLGTYSATAPFNCQKSKLIFEQGCDSMVKNMKNRMMRSNHITRSFNALALLSTGKQEYLPIIKAEAKDMADHLIKGSGSLRAWYYGPANILLAEYIIATGDHSMLPVLEKITMDIVDGQSMVGSWGHKFVGDTGRLRGYGMMNAPGVPLTISLILAKKAGVRHPKLDTAITKSVNLLKFYVGKGSIPYGDHHPWIQTHEDNGKNGMAAVMFNILRDRKSTKYFSSMSVASHGAEREMGHTGNFFNILWAMPGVAISGPNASGTWMKEFGWYYDLARRWDGVFIHQGPPKEKYDSYRYWDASGVYLLAYAQSTKSLYMTGKESDVVPQISREEALKLIDDGRGWTPRLRSKEYQSYSVSRLMEGLKSWSPVVRERSASELARRKVDNIEQLKLMLRSFDTNTRIGACQAIGMMKGRGSSAVNDLKAALKADDVWLQIKAAEALAAIGEAAMPVAPELLKMLSEKPKAHDPRGMLQRYLCFALFNRRGGMFSRSLKGVNKEQLFKAVKNGLANEDGRARGAIKSVYSNLSFEELKPIMPEILKAIKEPAPSGIMFAHEIQEAGLDLLVKHKVDKGLDLTTEFVKTQKKHGSQKRILKLLKMIESYGAHAKKMIPILEKHAYYFDNEEKDFPKKLSKDKANAVRKTIENIKGFSKKPALISI